jgi:hypothetical protein
MVQAGADRAVTAYKPLSIQRGIILPHEYDIFGILCEHQNTHSEGDSQLQDYV